jgi:hypothetical protein
MINYPDTMQALVMPGHPQTYYWERQYYYIKPDDFGVRNDRTDCPMTVQVRPEATIPYTPALQQFNFERNRTGNDATDKLAFADCHNIWKTKKIIGGHYDTGGYNAITGEGNPNDLPALEVNIQIAGNVFSGIEQEADGIATILNGTQVLKINTIHPDDISLYFGLSYTDRPDLFHHIIIIKSQLAADGHRVRNPAPQLEGRDGHPVITAVISPFPMYIRMSALIKLELGAPIPPPYNPAW